MAVAPQLITVETFEQFLSTHLDGLYELIHGEIVGKVPTQEHEAPRRRVAHRVAPQTVHGITASSTFGHRFPTRLDLGDKLS